MNSSTIVKIQKHLETLINHLEPTREFLNMHMVGWISENLFDKHVPVEIRDEIKNIDDCKSAMKLFFDQNNPSPDLITKHKHLYNHIQQSKTFYLENLSDKLYLNVDELLDEFQSLNIPINKGLSFNVRQFMKDKKNHEVEIASSIVGTLACARNKQHFVLDIGDGKGYLSTRLALEFNLKVLGIDGNPDNVRLAESRNERLTKIWTHLVRKEAEKNNVEVSEIKQPQQEEKNYRSIPSFIYNDTNLNELIEKAYPDENIDDILIAGLHACGNLSANILKHFVNNDKIKLVMSVPCCYNLLFEEFEIDFFNGVERKIDHPNDFGFPLSNFLREKQYRIGRNARMLATQCFERILQGTSLPDDSLFYRSIFEKLLRTRWKKGEKLHVYRLGKIKRVKSLEEYLRKACGKLNLEYDLSADELENLENDHALDKEKIIFNYFYRLLFSKIIETVINLDRFLYLHEHNIKHVFLVKMFDSVISPRNHAIIAIKD